MTGTTQAALRAGHTPTPWRQEALMGRGPNNEAVFHCGLGIRGPADVREQEANAAFIVRAANENAEIASLREQSLEDQAARQDFAVAIGCPIGRNVYEFAREERAEMLSITKRWAALNAEMLAALKDVAGQAYSGRNDFDNFTSYRLDLILDAARAAIDRAEGRHS